MVDKWVINNRYEQRKTLGAGGMGSVFEVYDRLNQQRVALKRVQKTVRTPSPSMLNPDVTQPADMSTDSAHEYHLALTQEFRILAKLRHPNIISVLDYGFDETQQPFFTMELLEGATNVLDFASELSFDQQVHIILDILQALVYLHRHQILHRDLKPENVLIQANRLRLLDFGLSTTADNAHDTVGTMGYMAPEIFVEEPMSHASDLYSLGVIAYKLFTGELPFPAMNINAILYHQPKFDALSDNPLMSVIARLLMKQPADRYASALDTIRAICQSLDIPLPVESQNVRESYLQNARFVGREQELATLRTALKRISKGMSNNGSKDKQKGSAWLIGGESGIGKTRLLDELRIHALLERVVVIRGQGVQNGGLPYQIWRNVVKRLCMLTPPSELDASILVHLLPDLPNILDHDIMPAPELEGEAGRKRLIESIQRVLRAQTQPILFLMEDLQWTEESLIVLHEVMHIIEPLSVMVVGSYRDDERPELPQRVPQMQVLPLSRLDANKVAELSESMIGKSGKNSRFVNYITKESEGNALFIVEVLRYLADEAGRLDEIPNMTLPPNIFAGGIRQIAIQRIRNLHIDYQPMLRLAAVAGREIQMNILQYYDDEMDYEDWIQRCIDVALLTIDDGVLRFTHDKMRQGVLAGLPEQEKRRLNMLVAEAIEDLYPADPDYAIILAEHWHDAGEPEREAFYCYQAGFHQMKLGYVDLARKWANRALNLNAIDETIESALLALAGTIEFTIGQYEQAEKHYLHALQLAREHGQTSVEADALQGLGRVKRGRGIFDEAEEYYRQCLTIRQQLKDKRGMSSVLMYMAVLARMHEDEHSALQWTRKSIAYCRASNNQATLAGSLYQLGVLLRNRGKFKTAIKNLEESIAICRTIGDTNSLADSLNMLGICKTLSGDYDSAETYLNEGMEVREKTGHKRGVCSSRSAIGDLHWLREDYETAYDQFNQSLKFWQTIDDKWNIANSYADTAYPLAMMGKLKEAESAIEHGLQIATELNSTFIITKALIALAWIAYGEGKVATAQSLLAEIDKNPALNAPLRRIRFDPLLDKLKPSTAKV